MKAWHFTDGMNLRDGTPLVVGKTYKFEGRLELCKSGYHASAEPFDALAYAPGSWLSLVECGGEIIKGEDKLVCSERTALKTINIEKELRLFAVWCARGVAHLMNGKRGLDAIDVDELFVYGEASIDELRAAEDAAGSAARSKQRKEFNSRIEVIFKED